MSLAIERARTSERRIDAGYPIEASEENPQTQRDLTAMALDGALFSVMVGAGETYIPAFVLEAGLGEVAAGLITTLPLLAGASLQLLAMKGVRWLGSHKRWVIASVTLQALCFVPLALAALSGGISLWLVFLLASCYWGAGMSANAAWSSWAETVVPTHIRARYFSRRTRLTQLGTLIGIVGAGLTINWSKSGGHVMLAFVAVFAVSALCRFASAMCLTRQSEPEPLPKGQRWVGLGDLYSRIRKGGSERLLVYLVAMQFGVYISGPFFTPYMLKKLQLPYTTYVWLVASCFAAKMIALPLWGRVAHRAGAQRLLLIGGIGVIPISAMWLVSNSLPYLYFLQVAGGIVWAAYELAMLLLFFETLRREERTALMSLYNVGNAAAMVAGSLVGGMILGQLGKTPAAYLTLFGLSSVFRFCTLGLLWTLPRLRLAETPVPAAVVVPVPEPITIPMTVAERTSSPDDSRSRKTQPAISLAN